MLLLNLLRNLMQSDLLLRFLSGYRLQMDCLFSLAMLLLQIFVFLLGSPPLLYLGNAADKVAIFADGFAIEYDILDPKIPLRVPMSRVLRFSHHFPSLSDLAEVFVFRLAVGGVEVCVFAVSFIFAIHAFDPFQRFEVIVQFLLGVLLLGSRDSMRLLLGSINPLQLLLLLIRGNEVGLRTLD